MIQEMYHYLIADNRSNVVNVYNLQTTGTYVTRKKCLYHTTKSVKTNRTISMVENRIVDVLDIEDHFNCVELSEKCRILYNIDSTILEMDGCNSDVALGIFSLIANNKEQLVFFDIDDDLIVEE